MRIKTKVIKNIQNNLDLLTQISFHFTDEEVEKNFGAPKAQTILNIIDAIKIDLSTVSKK